jgi:hypothetical protein
MNQCSIHLLDLPDEVLLSILKKLDNVDVLYSLLGINNERLDSLAQEKIFTNTLNFVTTGHISSIINSILDRFCNYTLLRIHHSVEYLIIEPVSMNVFFLLLTIQI